MPESRSEYHFLKIELDLMAQRMIQGFLLHNEKVNGEIENGIKGALEKFDFEGEFARQVDKAVSNIIRDVMQTSKLREIVSNKVGELIDRYIHNQLHPLLPPQFKVGDKVELRPEKATTQTYGVEFTVIKVYRDGRLYLEWTDIGEDITLRSSLICDSGDLVSSSRS